MIIKIAERFRPFSHTFGTTCLLPGTTFAFTIFPTKILVRNLENANTEIINTLTNSLSGGSIEKFLIKCDFEHFVISVEGYSKNEFFRYTIIPKENNNFSIENMKKNIEWKADKPLVNSNFLKFDHDLERLHLGVNKKLDWDLVKRRLSMAEILPLWFYLGQQTLSTPLLEGDSLLSICEEKIRNKNKNEIVNCFKDLFLTGFYGILTPRLIDEDFQGYSYPPLISQSPLTLLNYGKNLIRKLFFQKIQENEFSILPCLPPEFHCGRILNLNCDVFGKLDVEWTKKLIRRMKFKVNKTCALTFHFQKKIKSFRLTSKNSPTSAIVDSNQILLFQKDEIYYFDRFLC